MNHWMFRCKDVSQKVSLSMDMSLPLHHRLAIRVHLVMCRYCARFRRQLMLLRTTSRLIDGDLPSSDPAFSKLSNQARERIKKTLHSHH
ncbi:MAG: hypothetical protein PVG51_02410 [Desulfosarcina sp.]|jgi:hypothetical protein